MSSLQRFNFNSQKVRTVSDDQQVWFVASDVSKVLGYRMASDMTRRLDAEDRGTRSVRTPSGDQTMTVISHTGLIEAALYRKSEAAKQFRKWVTNSVLPEVMQNGIAPAPVPVFDWSNPVFQRQMLESQLATLDRAEAAEAQLAIAAPKAAALDTMVANGEEYEVRTAAQMLQNQVGVKLGRNRLFAWLRDREWIDDDNQPYQRYVEQEWLTVKLSNSGHWSQGEWVEHLPTLLVTAKGLAKIHERMVKELNAPAPLALVQKPKARNQSRLSLEDSYRRGQSSRSVRKPRIA